MLQVLTPITFRSNILTPELSYLNYSGRINLLKSMRDLFAWFKYILEPDVLHNWPIAIY